MRHANQLKPDAKQCREKGRKQAQSAPWIGQQGITIFKNVAITNKLNRYNDAKKEQQAHNLPEAALLQNAKAKVHESKRRWSDFHSQNVLERLYY